jgi:hypothetical protein
MEIEHLVVELISTPHIPSVAQKESSLLDCIEEAGSLDTSILEGEDVGVMPGTPDDVIM